MNDVVLGLGSCNGDDQFGWKVIEELLHSSVNASLHKIRHPIDLLSWLDANVCVHLVDAVVGLPHDGSLIRLEMTNPVHRSQIQSIPCTGTHDVDLSEVLMLAESLGKPTDQVVLWLGRAESIEPMTSLSPGARQSVQQCIDQLTQQLGWSQ
ncbi:hydrogenase maturation protease [Rhodopirellula maiorica SM1]|uniref:Hydrogenase maturation protease n=1 Tax=Rhodopirellula maiorica SM1 TaxID=1265738 RepID=M5RWW9_9BACT|nr:hydrogenase maturation protease [Rhodopirellula maiorica]EMI18449.1 hydrogenase maturation protease [Rhodopirellula maiorica SM1]